MVPTLSTSRLQLSAFSPNDAQAVFEYASNPEVAKTVTWEAHRNPADSLAFIEFITQKISEKPFFFAWAIREKGKAIGSFSFSQPLSHIGQIDYAIGADYWNKGLMTEAAQAVVNWALEKPSLLRIQAKCLSHNIGSRRVMEKVGMQYEGITKAALLVKGKPADLAVYALVRPQC